jgi:hypothetical protein
MPYETDFDTAFTILLGKAQGIIAPTPTPVPPVVTAPTGTVTAYTINFLFGGGSAALTAGGQNPLLAEVPDAGEIVWAHLYAGTGTGAASSVSATVELYRTFGTLTTIYGGGTKPTLSSQSSANMSLSGWFTHLDAGEQVIADLATFSGTASWLALVLRIRRDTA